MKRRPYVSLLAMGPLALSAPAGRLAAADLSPADFAFGMPVAAGAPAAAYRLTLPLSVYQNLAREDLADIRVFNASGEVVPYALSRPAARTLAHSPGISLPLFALRGESAGATDAVRVTIDSPNAAFRLQTQGSSVAGESARGSVKQYFMDGRAVTVPVTSLQFAWPDGAADFTGRLRIDVSDDFAAWRTLADAAPIANLHANGQQLLRDRVEFPPSRAKYWRLSWVGKGAPFELTAVVAEAADSRVDAERSTLDVAGRRGAGADEYLFDLGARLPIENINLMLPELNTVANIELSSRRHPLDPWGRVIARQFYRVDSADGELRNQAIDIATDSDRYWRVHLIGPGGAASAHPPRLQAAWTPSDVVFLARGSGPFMLAFGSAVAPAAESDLSSVSAALTVVRATLGERRTLGGQTLLAPPAAAIPWERVMLWSVLGISVCLLAGMAYRLTKEIGPRSPS